MEFMIDTFAVYALIIGSVIALLAVYIKKKGTK
ncbi:EYxxD motif small membrane protein [Bacillus sp. FJAT-45350]